MQTRAAVQSRARGIRVQECAHHSQQVLERYRRRRAQGRTGPPSFDQAGRQRGLCKGFTIGAGHTRTYEPARREVARV